MRGSTLPDAEHDVTLSAGYLRHGSRIAGAAGHDVTVERRREIYRIAIVERDAQEVRVRGRALVRVQCNGENSGTIRRPAEGEGSCVGERDQSWIGHPVGSDDVDRRAEDQVAVRRHRSRKRKLFPVRRPGRIAAVPVAARDLAALPSFDLDHVQVRADAAPHPYAVCLVVEALGDEWSVSAASPVVLALPRRCQQIDGRGEGDLRAVGAPDGPSGTERQFGQRPRLASLGREEPDLRRPVTGAEEGDRGAVGRPRGRGVGLAGCEPLGIAGATADAPQRRDVPIGGRIVRPQHVDDLLPVG